MDRIIRRETRPVKVGNVTIGGGSPIAVQSMTNTRTTEINATLEQIDELAKAGCELVRVAIPDLASAAAFEKIVSACAIPLIADVHFDVRLAHLAIQAGAAEIRINPGNIGGRKKLINLAKLAQQHGAAIRVGVNAGSLERKIMQKYGSATAEAMLESALGYLEVLESISFHDVIISLKSSDVYTTIAACRMISEKTVYPLHLGVTGAGPVETGAIKNAVGIGTLLAEGIGDTIRVSLTASPVEEVRVARQILQSLGLRRFSPELISCPTCGRCETDLLPLVASVEQILKKYQEPLKVAVMGCAVNGPGEAKEADLGISAGKKHGIVFRHGKVVKTVELDQLLNALQKELDLYSSIQPPVR